MHSKKLDWKLLRSRHSIIVYPTKYKPHEISLKLVTRGNLSGNPLMFITSEPNEIQRLFKQKLPEDINNNYRYNEFLENFLNHNSLIIIDNIQKFYYLVLPFFQTKYDEIKAKLIFIVPLFTSPNVLQQVKQDWKPQTLFFGLENIKRQITTRVYYPEVQPEKLITGVDDTGVGYKIKSNIEKIKHGNYQTIQLLENKEWVDFNQDNLPDYTEKNHGWITDLVNVNLQSFSPKLNIIINNLNNIQPDDKHIIFTRFNKKYGFQFISSVLMLNQIDYTTGLNDVKNIYLTDMYQLPNVANKNVHYHFFDIIDLSRFISIAEPLLNTEYKSITFNFYLMTSDEQDNEDSQYYRFLMDKFNKMIKDYDEMINMAVTIY